MVLSYSENETPSLKPITMPNNRIKDAASCFPTATEDCQSKKLYFLFKIKH